MVKHYRSILSLLPLAATLATGTATNLEVGTAFGANWAEVESELRNGLLSSMEEVRTSCATDAVCPFEVAEFCGYNEHKKTYSYRHKDLHSNKTVKRTIFDDLKISENVRHVFEGRCEWPHFGPGCYLDLCLRACFPDKSSVSSQCLASIAGAECRYKTLRLQEESDDRRETFYRYSIPLMGLLSMLSSILTVCLHKHERQMGPNHSSAWCEKFFVAVDVITAVTLLGLVTMFCPLLLVVLVPPYVIVQAVYLLCFAETTEEDDDYHLLEDDPDAIEEGICIPVTD